MFAFLKTPFLKVFLGLKWTVQQERLDNGTLECKERLLPNSAEETFNFQRIVLKGQRTKAPKPNYVQFLKQQCLLRNSAEVQSQRQAPYVSEISVIVEFFSRFSNGRYE